MSLENTEIWCRRMFADPVAYSEQVSKFIELLMDNCVRGEAGWTGTFVH
jgi:hypothetical protein